MNITETIARKVLETVDAGLVKGVGDPVPGKMCVEAAVCYALGLPHGDNPECVSASLRELKIRLNDSPWSSNQARANGLRRLAVAQLGSAGFLNETEFVQRLSDYAIRVSAPKALRAAASIQKNPAHEAALLSAANRCEIEGTSESARDATNAAYACAATCAATNAAYAANAATCAANAAAYTANATCAAAYAANALDKSLAEYAEHVVQILIDLKAPGCAWLTLTAI